MSAINAKASRKTKKYAVLTREPRCFLGSLAFSWEQRKFGKVFMSLQNNTLSRAELNDEFGAAQNIHYGDVLIKYDEILDVSKEPLSYIEKQSIADKFKTSYLQNGDVIIADTAEDETVGKCTEIEGLTDQKVISGLHTMPVRPNRKFASGFLGFYLNSAAYHDQLKPLMQGIKVTSISKGAMQDTVVKFPLDLKEQEQIGIYFGGLDHLITLHQRQPFLHSPPDISLIVQLTPPFYTFSWEQRKLGELALFNPKDELPQIFEYVDLESVVGTEMLSHRTEVKSSAPSRAQRLAHTGDLFYQTVRPYQKNNYLFERPDNNYVFSTGYAQMRPYVDGYFLLSLVQSERFVKVVLDNCTGTSYPAINANDLAEIEVAAPSDESEAQKIGTIFRSIDNLITLHQRKPFLMKWRTSDANRNQTNRLVL